MTRYWSDQLGGYIEAEPVWNGRGPMPHQVEGRCWHQTSSPLLDAAPERGAYPSTKEIARANLVTSDYSWRQTPVSPGRPKGSKSTTPARAPMPRVSACMACHQPLTADQQRKGVTRCPACRKASPGTRMRRRAA